MTAPKRWTKKGPRGFECLDCGTNTSTICEYYMVHSYLWHLANPDRPEGMLCIGCLENRIGRQLRSGDFIHAPINIEGAFGFVHSQRLRNRLETP